MLGDALEHPDVLVEVLEAAEREAGADQAVGHGEGVDEAAALRPQIEARRRAAESLSGEVMRAMSDLAMKGGVFEVVAWGVPPGLGSHVQWDRKLDGRLAQAMMW